VYLCPLGELFARRQAETVSNTFLASYKTEDLRRFVLGSMLGRTKISFLFTTAYTLVNELPHTAEFRHHTLLPSGSI
jgi:hypothetical protein